MTDRDKRPKASEIFEHAHYFPGEKVSFEEAFPEIDDINVKVIEHGKGAEPYRERNLDRKSIGQYINCSNSICYGGGFLLGAILHDMVREKQTEHETTEKCQGYEGSPKGKVRYGKCLNSFKVQVSIKYKEG